MLDIRNCDNMDLMREFPDKYFDLAIVDPPYGLGDKLSIGGKKHMKFANRYRDGKPWDVVPEQEYFTELRRVSKNQIIWGGNYFDIGTTRGFIVWDKKQPVPNFAACDFAWTSFDCPSKIFRFSRTGGAFDNNKIHPTQKPVELYKYCLEKFAVPEDKILDTHLGSGSIAIACHDYGFDLTACELDKDYYEAAMKRINAHVAQQKLFV